MKCVFLFASGRLNYLKLLGNHFLTKLLTVGVDNDSLEIMVLDPSNERSLPATQPDRSNRTCFSAYSQAYFLSRQKWRIFVFLLHLCLKATDISSILTYRVVDENGSGTISDTVISGYDKPKSLPSRGFVYKNTEHNQAMVRIVEC